MSFTTLKLNRSPTRLPASAFPNRADAYFCDNCERDLTKHLHPGRAHVWQAMGPERSICRCGREWPTGAVEWDQFSPWERRRRLRDVFAWSIVASVFSSIVATFAYFILRLSWSGAAAASIILAALPGTLMWVPFLSGISVSVWRTRIRPKS
jgi:hypothetical protein